MLSFDDPFALSSSPFGPPLLSLLVRSSEIGVFFQQAEWLPIVSFAASLVKQHECSDEIDGGFPKKTKDWFHFSILHFEIDDRWEDIFTRATPPVVVQLQDQVLSKLL
jgi:hypothetical protein